MLTVDFEDTPERVELNAEDLDDGLSAPGIACSYFLRELAVVVFALRNDTSVPRTPLSIPSKTREGDFGAGGG